MYLVEDKQTKERFVLKKFKAQDEDSRQSIVNETSLSNLLRCDHLINVVELVENVGVKGIAGKPDLLVLLEHMDGGDFCDIVTTFNEHYSEAFCQYSLWMAAMGINKMHENKVLHRDIKADNILMHNDG